MLKLPVILTFATLAFAGGVHAEPPKGMAALTMMTGVWRGEAKGVGRDGKPFTIVQTERVGPMLDGQLLVVEGRGYGDGGKLAFNAFGVISYDAQSGGYEFRAYTGGHGGTFPLKLTETGAVWEMPAGPDAIMRFTIDFSKGEWHETGEYIAGGQAHKTIELTLKRMADTDWPAAGAVMP
ncbi:hypothetical protein AEAC466_11265 [Asticcacaulis sp. AC466]|uniref:hypothetical protein n=1 Tax=Asticcacaulis sp. AC466 TaxID=1282362 RepID=UPI0003C3FD6F|nr:hypothetical protein [Asticcacaulis sp. AC466]ESQ83900.1 hypothetical protein AEAC466_11265 [Asticcacaulis sp. AC466]